MPTIRPRTRQPLAVHFPRTGVLALESRHARRFAMPFMRHDYLKALLVFSGLGELHADGCAFPLAPGGVVVVPPGREHRIADRRPLSLYVVCFRADEFSSGWPGFIRESGNISISSDTGGILLGLARRLLHEQAARWPAAETMARGLAWQMLALLARLPRATPQKPGRADPDGGSRTRVAEAARELRDRFYEPLRIDEEAGRAGLGRRRFTQIFREVTGLTWWEALNAARLDHAERLLGETDRSVAAVAFECGYGDLSGFYRAWSRRHPASPQAWRVAKRDNQRARNRRKRLAKNLSTHAVTGSTPGNPAVTFFSVHGNAG